MTGKEYKLAVRIAGIVDKSFNTSLVAASGTLRKTALAVDRDLARLDKGFNKVIGLGIKLGAVAGTASVAVAAAMADCTEEASKFEHQMADVVKYVNGLADGAGRASNALALDKDGGVINGKTYAENYREAKEALLDLSMEIPKTAEELTELAALPGSPAMGLLICSRKARMGKSVGS